MWPKTIQEAAITAKAKLRDAEKQAIKSMNEDDLVYIHFGFGDYIRNEFGLWSGNNALLESCGSPDMHL